MQNESFVSANVTPPVSMPSLSPHEVARLQDDSASGLYHLFRKCCLAVLNTGSEIDSTKLILERFKDFDIRITAKNQSVQLVIENAPASAFVDGEIIEGIKEHLFSVLRDLLYMKQNYDLVSEGLSESEAITHRVFQMIRHANVMVPKRKPNLVVCWGGHSISRYEYDYTKKVGYELGLRGMDICTGCGPGAMKGPMKGATISHAKQRLTEGVYLGITEPGIIAAESPNPIVNQLMIMPDIEKRLEAFVRLGHAIIVFPGGAGTAEEILYLLGILLHEKNRDVPYPLIFTGPEGSENYFAVVDAFIKMALGEEAAQRYKIIIGDPIAVAAEVKASMQAVTDYRRQTHEAYHYNWGLHIPEAFQKPFDPTHENMETLNISRSLNDSELAGQLRRALSAIVAGNVKEPGIRAIEEFGPFNIHGDADIMAGLDDMLKGFITQKRMSIDHENYVPCYKIVTGS
ncbi:MAG: nucleotide 5'-monophosphate nucleosidase PpnN [Pontibacterium sp.]